MRLVSRWAFALVVVVVLTVPMYGKAVTYDEVVQEIDFEALSGSDEVQNNLDGGAETNLDTWDPVPSGSWFGGWSKESKLRLADVPDTDFSVVYASVARFTSDIIMSGASRTLVRLPVHTPSSGYWTSARLQVYEISGDTNWTFRKENATASTWGTSLGQARINFTSGTQELIFWSQGYDPTDASPTDYDDHFTRSNRTYAFVDAPIRPDVLTLWVTTLDYPSDAYVDAYVQPDTLDAEGEVNHSSLAVFNEIAPDTYELDVDHQNFSWGYSWDFRNGFGNSAYGLNVWMESGEDLEFLYYVDYDEVNGGDYLSFHLPYMSTTTNVSWTISMSEYDPTDGSVTEFASWGDYICNDFVLFSLPTDWSTCSTAAGLDLTGWIYVSCQVNNDTRIRVPLWDWPQAPEDARPNRSWGGSHAFVVNVWGGEPSGSTNYDMTQWVRHDVTGSQDYYYHWSIQASIQWNSYQWTRSVPATSSHEDVDLPENMTLTQQVFYTASLVLFKTSDQWFSLGTPFGQVIGAGFRAAGVVAEMIARIPDLPDPFGWAADKLHRIKEFFQDVGQWLWRVGQEIVGALRWFVETVTYFASVILGLLLVVMAIAIPLLLAWVSMKMGQTFVALMRWRTTEAVGHMTDLAAMAGKLKPGRRGGG